MLDLIMLRENSQHQEPIYKEFEFRGKKFKTAAGRLIPGVHGVDKRLAGLICACMATNARFRPPLWLLHSDLATVYIPGRTPDLYQNRAAEEDEAITKLWRDIVYNGDPPEVILGPEDEEDDIWSDISSELSVRSNYSGFSDLLELFPFTYPT